MALRLNLYKNENDKIKFCHSLLPKEHVIENMVMLTINLKFKRIFLYIKHNTLLLLRFLETLNIVDMLLAEFGSVRYRPPPHTSFCIGFHVGNMRSR